MTRWTMGMGVLAALIGCNDPVGSASVPDGGSDGAVGGGGDAARETGEPFATPRPFAVPLSATGPDQLQSAAAGPAGSFYVAGYASATAGGAKKLVVAKLTRGGLDPSFGQGGVTTTSVEFAGGAGEIAIGVQPSGKVVVAATVQSAGSPADRDVAVVRLDANGALDPSFGVAGVVLLDLGSAVDASQPAQRDAAHGLVVGRAGEIFLHASTRGEGPRTDSDFALVKLTVDGALDTSFNGTGKRTLDLGTPSANASPRGLQVLSDGTLVASGYATSSLSANTPQVVLYKVTAAGALDPTFADNGVFHAVVLTLQTEAYSVVVHGGNLVTGGYGRNTGTTNSWVSLRFDAQTGARDVTWGGAPGGAVVLDPGGKALGASCRSALALPGGKTLLLGSAGPSNTPAQDAAFAILTAEGRLDAAYGAGVHVVPFGAEGGSDQLWGAAVSDGQVLAVGFRGAGATQTELLNDDSYAMMVPLK